MAVTAIASKTLGGSNVSDVLSGSTTGYDIGTVTSDTATTPVNTIYFRHNGANTVTDISYYIGVFSGTYGGDYSASLDLTKIIAHGDSGSGLQIEEVFNAGTPFAGSYFTVNNTNGRNYGTRRTMRTTSFLYNNASVETTPTTPVQGQLGAFGDTVLGDNAKLRMRYVVPTTETLVGIHQYDLIVIFSYTT